MQRFLGETMFPAGCLYGECSVLSSFAPMIPAKTREFFEYGRSGQIEKLFRMQSEYLSMVDEIPAPMLEKYLIDGACDKCSCPWEACRCRPVFSDRMNLRRTRSRKNVTEFSTRNIQRGSDEADNYYDAHSHLGEFTTTRKRADGATLSTLFEKSRLTHGVTFSIEACYGAVDLGNGYAVNQVVAQARLSAMIVPTEASARWIQQAAQNPIIVGIQPWANTMFSEPASCA